MAINIYQALSVADTLATINELSATYDWGITAVMDSANIAIKDSDENIVMKLFFSDSSGNGIRCYYNNGSSSIGRNDMALDKKTCDIYSTSHGFIILSHAPYYTTWFAFLNVNDDGKIICGTMTNYSTDSSTVSRAAYLSVCSYGDSAAMNLGFTPRPNISGTTVCNMIGNGTLADPSIAQYAFYVPVYQSSSSGTADIDGEQYISVGHWYMKD